ncbi:hypothetical protein QFC22_005832 [Naganishia vaughanmartiniae]|uniref:Uncharacterized protein n=1 Tax=Naganishia vaughanmartiniae TaxID=1424756 RepID=A0ACC2WSJ5_9TREE|nr:hypothetical protein QFC22_005832 [Naganishia vaughanmartiniae]
MRSSNTRVFEGREDAVRIDGAPEITKDELKRVKALVNERKATYKTSLGLTIKAAAERALQSLTPSERRVIETSTHGKRANTASARDIRAAHFERLLATKPEQDNPIGAEEDKKPSSAKVEPETDNTSDASDSAVGEDERDLDEYAQEFLCEMDEDEKRVAKGDDVHFFESVKQSPQPQLVEAAANTGTSRPSRDHPQTSVGQSSSAGRASPHEARGMTRASQFGQRMVDDEKREVRADLLGLRSSGRTLGVAPWQSHSDAPLRHVAKIDEVKDDDVIVIED